MSTGSILIVCTGNVCRSPVGEVALRALLPESFDLSSAGTHAMVGSAAAPETLEFVARELDTKLDFTARQLTREMAEAADLIISMTVEQRAWIARTAPRTVRRTFTLKEIEKISFDMPPNQAPLSFRELAVASSRLRGRLAAEGTDLDIEDPYGGPPGAYEESFQQVLNSSRELAASIRAFT